MLTKKAIVRVNNRPVSDISDYMRVLKLEVKDLKTMWEKEAREMQKTLGNNFKVEIKMDKISRWNVDNLFHYLFKITVKQNKGL